MPPSPSSNGRRSPRSRERLSSIRRPANDSSGSALQKKTTSSPTLARESVPSGSDTRRFVVPEALEGRPLDRALRELADLSWGDARTLIRRGKVKVAGALATEAERRVAKGDTVEVDPRASSPNRTAKLDPSAIVYVDPHVVVVD